MPPLGPLDRDDGVAGRQLVEPEVRDFGGFETVEIDVMQRQAAAVLLDERERRARHLVVGHAQPAREAADERGLARAEIAEQQHDRAGRQAPPEPLAGRQGFLFAAADNRDVVRGGSCTAAVDLFRRALDAAARGQLQHRVAETRGDVAGDERHFPFVRFGEIAGRAVQIDRELAGGLRVEQLREPRRDHAGEEVARAAGRHPGVAGEVDERAVVGSGNDRAVALQHHVDAMVRGERRRVLQAIVLDGLDADVEQARHLARDAA